MLSRCYGMLLPSYLEGYPCNAKEKWDCNVGPLDEELWHNVLDSVLHGSLNTAQRLYLLFIVLHPFETAQHGYPTDLSLC